MLVPIATARIRMAVAANPGFFRASHTVAKVLDEGFHERVPPRIDRSFPEPERRYRTGVEPDTGLGRGNTRIDQALL